MSVPKLRFDGFSGNWVTTQLGNICSFTQGVQIPQSEQINEERDGYIRYLYIRDFFSDKFKCYVPNIYPEKIIHPHEIMMVNTGNTTGEAYTRRYGVLSNNSFKIDYDLAHFNDQFMYLFCSSELAQNQIKKFFNAGGQPHLGHKNISQILISYPKKEEQTKIASFLSAVDEKISQLSQKHVLLSQYKQGMMQKLFSQQIRFKADDGSEFGEWETTTLGQTGKFIGGGTPSKENSEFWEGSIPWISSSDLTEESIFKINITRFISQNALNQSATKLVPANSILIVSRVGVGKVAITPNEICTSQDFTSLTLHKGSSIFFAYLIKSLTPYLLEMNQGTSIKGFIKDDLANLELKIPCIEEQTKIANFLSAIDQKIEVVAQQIEQAKTWKKGLLQQMFI